MKKEKRIIQNPGDCISLLSKYGRMKQEHFGVIFLNLKKEVIQTKCFFVGSDDRCSIYPKIVFWKACKLEASAMVMFHNHPNGNTSPSQYDIELTEKFERGGELLGIQILDHIIIGKYDYYSFLEHDKMNREENQVKAKVIHRRCRTDTQSVSM